MITGGGKDGTLYEWNQDYEKTGRSLKVPDPNGTIRFITCGKGQNLFLVGTTKNCVYQANFEMNYMNCLVNSHVEELWGICSNPRESYFLTGGNDKNLFYWDALSHRLIWSSQLEDQLHSVCIHPEFDIGKYLKFKKKAGLIKSQEIRFHLQQTFILFTKLTYSLKIS